VEDQGGVENASGGAFLPRDRQQITNFARNSKNEKCDLMDLAKSQERVKNNFVRDYAACLNLQCLWPQIDK
jgi:hypothetical protein